MDSTWLVLAALALGTLIGAAFVVLFLIAERRGSSAVQVVNPTIPDGIDQMLDALETAGVVLDPSNNVLKASPGALAMGLVWDRALVHGELVALVDAVRRTGDAMGDEVTVTRGPIGDTTLQLRVRAARLGTRYVMLLAEDRTEANRLDQVRRDFVANISHELKTPIASVSLLAEALDHAAGDPDQVRRFAHRLGMESARLARITNEIIELSRLQAHEAVETASRVDLDALVRQAVEQNRVIAAAKRVDIVVKAKSRASVYGDEPLLRVAVHNLVANALTYSNEGSRVGVAVLRADDGVVEVVVTDQGIGIAEADLDRVFERFYRVDQARARDTGGSGLGLAIVKHTVQNHGGEVRVWSQPGRGSTFTIRLPEAADDPAPQPDPSTSADAVPRVPEETRK